MGRHRWLAGLSSTLALALAACAAGAFPIPTPLGPVAADHFEPMDLLGISEVRTHSNTGPVREGLTTEEVDLPAGTEFVIPVISGWHHWIGDDPGSAEVRFGFAAFNIIVDRWEVTGEPDTGGSTSLSITANLAPEDPMVDRGYGRELSYRLLFLRRADEPTVPVANEDALERWRLVGEAASYPRAPGRTDGDTPAEVTDRLRTPEGATDVVANLQGFVLGFGPHGGRLAPAILQPPFVQTRLYSEARVGIDFGAGATTDRELTTTLHLRDGGGDDAWYGGADYGFLSARPEAGATGAWLRIVGILGRTARHVSGEPGEDPSRHGFFDETHTALVPAETDVVIPLVAGWSLGFGHPLVDPLTEELLWRAEGGAFGSGQVSVLATGLRAGPTPEFKSASIRVALGLRSEEATSDGERHEPRPWFGTLRYTLLCLQIVDA